jgi:multiple RNA-binding domain-containing protein 1
MFDSGDVAVPEGESDDEYEQIPSRKEKSRRTESFQVKPDLAAQQSPPREKKAEDGGDTSEVPGGKNVEGVDSEMTDLGVSAKNTTDDDWLRSRTNRLLDLVDPDDLESGAVSSLAEGTAKQDTENDALPPHSSAEVTPDAVVQVATSEETATEDNVHAISRTSRLFARNLPYSATEDDIRETFEKFGTLQEVR